MYVYFLEARFVDPFTGFDGRPDRVEKTRNAFATREVAESRVEKFKGLLRQKLKVRDDYPLEIRVIEVEVIAE